MTDDELIEKMAREAYSSDITFDEEPDYVQESYREYLRDVLTVCRPIIEAQERERCARIVDGWSANIAFGLLAAAIREGERDDVN